MTTDTTFTEVSTSSREQFFESNYTLLREQPPMKWMGRLFLRLTDGWYPRLVDLPTGAGKTDIAVIWVLALAWYGLNTGTRNPTPRRLVWVVNRRVLVQQVFKLAGKLQQKLSVDNPDPGSLADVREGLGRLSGDRTDIFRVVQLRGQLIDDREWSVAPCAPQLIIGTVDQIGSRLLFQGYGLGKWSRPMQAALLGVDAWICVDEAHLVPAFVLTLRQAIRFMTAAPNILSPVFERLRTWVTELSATPALPPPNADSSFRLIASDEDDPRLKDRLLAARTRLVNVTWLANGERSDEAIERAAVELAGKVDSVAVFVHEPKAANKVAKGLGKRFKGRVLLITGRLRGYERDRLENEEVFKRFRSEGEGDRPGGVKETVFLVGTAAAEVGLDADAAAICCDFASLPTLLQRLGRLDRRGYLSRGFHASECEAPTMTIFAKRGEIEPDIRKRVLKMAKELEGEKDGLSALLMVGGRWKTAKGSGRQPNEEGTGAPAGETKETKEIDPSEVVNAATWLVLLGQRQGQSQAERVGVNPPCTWLKHPVACVTGGPIAVPPLTAALIEHWSATTDPRDDFLPVHPFLYGILPDKEGTPLVSLAFRLEMDALLQSLGDKEGDENEGQAVEEQVKEILRRFPPLRAEFHFVSVATARDWFSSTAASAVRVAHFDGDEWSVTPDRADRSFLRPGAILILPTLAGAHDSLKKLLEDTNDIERASRDVLEGVSTQRPSYWRRVVEVDAGDYHLKSRDGASRFEPVGTAEHMQSVPNCISAGDSPPGAARQPLVSCSLRVGTATFRFEYWKLKRQVQPTQFLKDHLARAESDAESIALASAPGNEYLRCLLVEAAKMHDEGKRSPKWQRAMGNTDLANPVAKPLIERPSSLGGFRHEWASLLDMRTCAPSIPDSLPEPDVWHWLDLWRHLVASHHGHLRPWLADRVLPAHAFGKQQQSALRLESAERFARLQCLLGPWRLAYLEALLKATDVAASQTTEQEESDEQ
jgi:CRISPR-associated helicase Cas3